MQAVRFVGVGRPAQLQEVPKLSPAPGQVLIKIGGAGVCQPPAKAAPLSDAALTPYHAIKRALPQLDADSTVVVLGIGGLGHMAIQLLRVLAPVRIVAADVDDGRLHQARALGAGRGPAHHGPGREASRPKQRVDDRRPGRRPS